MKFSTIAIHEAQKPEGEYGAVITPIYQTTTFAQNAPADMKEGVLGAYDYSRSGNPTRTTLEKVLTRMEGGKHGYVFASGMAAMTTLTMALLSKGDHVIIGDDVYGGTFRLFDKTLKRFGIRASYVDMADAEAVRNAVTAETKMVLLETPTNPLLKLADLEGVTKVAKEYNLISVVDNTFATPYLQKPFVLGADIILHSTTKYINGHSDVVGGALILKDDKYAETIGFHQNSLGATADPLASWLTLRGLKTLSVRMERHSRNAFELAKFLEAHKSVESVIYPGLESHPQHDLAKRQMSAYGGMIALRVKGGAKEAAAFIKRLKYFILAESLGGVESLVEIPATMTHASLTSENRETLGITDNLIRLSVGIEDVEDLKQDLAQALDSL